MTYTFVCPSPCSRVIRTQANDIDDAIGKIIKAGGMACRNGEIHGSCDERHPQMSPLTERQLNELIRFVMEEEVP